MKYVVDDLLIRRWRGRGFRMEYTREYPVAPEISGFLLFEGQRYTGRSGRAFSLYAMFQCRPRGHRCRLYIQEKTPAKLVCTGFGHQIKATLRSDSAIWDERRS